MEGILKIGNKEYPLEDVEITPQQKRFIASEEVVELIPPTRKFEFEIKGIKVHPNGEVWVHDQIKFSHAIQDRWGFWTNTFILKETIFVGIMEVFQENIFIHERL